MSEWPSADFLRVLNVEQKRITLLAWPYLVAYILVNTAAYTYLDWYYWDLGGAYAWLGFLAWAFTYLLLLTLMNGGGCFEAGKASGIGTYFVLNLVTGLAIGLALVVFVLPGLYLLMRWLPVYARALTTEEWITQSMRWSWSATDPFQKPLSLALLGPVLCYGISIAASYSYDENVFESYQVAMVVTNLSLNIGVVWLTILGVAAFRLLSALGEQGALEPAAKQV